ncbi:glucan biosynthesis protein [Bowmanella yangjiangensis]|uniref:glucan biosynthesis protein n=1 Tax=Bowmanella yangjiangensis TaxID=2811230 RepID=UPI001E3C8A0B|nr:glucan biosynthesis protein G [Bowmanella yangjiangensis]
MSKPKFSELRNRAFLSVGLVVAILLILTTSVRAQQATTNQGKSNEQVLFDLMSKRAQNLAAQSYSQDEPDLPENWKTMSYPQYRAIRFKPDQALWNDQSLFEVQFFHPGFLYQQPVEIEEVNKDGMNKLLPFSASQFNYDAEAAPLASQSTNSKGYAGFRVHYPLNRPDYKDEVAVFQGASYFRLVGPNQVYGLSARGLAIDTAETSGEQFPQFKRFWLVKPEPNDTKLVFFALLDSPAVTGAYRFELSPGSDTHMQVTARLFARQDVKKLGIAPLTSMFFYGENKVRHVDDFRPEIHDSDGVLMQTAHGEWIWRALKNPRHLQVTSLADENPKGFGLLQRDRDFVNYQDSEAKYHQRPSMWIAPQGNWGKGRLEIVEIPTNNETNDNIVTYWVPETPLKAGEQREFSYSLSTFDSQRPEHHLAQVVSTRIGWSALPGEHNAPTKAERQFVVDFAGPTLAKLDSAQPINATLQLSAGSHRDLTVNKLPSGQWRVSFKLKPADQKPVDMRLQLKLRNETLSEVWNYVWNPTDLK